MVIMVIRKKGDWVSCPRCDKKGIIPRPKKKVADRITQELYKKFRQGAYAMHELCLENGNGWRMDFATMTKGGLVAEYEIKISLPDLKNDFKKLKHSYFKDKSPKWFKKDVGRYCSPNYFYYVIPVELLEKAEPLIPDYAGIIVMIDGDQYWASEHRAAPRLHKEKAFQEWERLFLTRAAWRLRSDFIKKDLMDDKDPSAI